MNYNKWLEHYGKIFRYECSCCNKDFIRNYDVENMYDGIVTIICPYCFKALKMIDGKFTEYKNLTEL